MDDLIFALHQRTRSPAWPDRWMTLTEFDGELDDSGFWESAGLAGWSVEGRRHWLRKALATEKTAGHAIWLRMGGRYKHFDLVRQNRGDLNDYLTWVAERRAARARSAEQLLAGETIVRATILHPLANPECAARAERLAQAVIDAVPDEALAQRMRRIWSIYEEERPADARVALRVCRLFCAMGTLVAEAHRFTPDVRLLLSAVRVAETWVNAQLCAPVEEEAEGPLARAS